MNRGEAGCIERVLRRARGGRSSVWRGHAPWHGSCFGRTGKRVPLAHEAVRMSRMTLDDLRKVLPASEALRPLMDRLAALASPDLQRIWSGSGEMETLGGRLVDGERMQRALPDLLEEIRLHLDRLYGAVVRAVNALNRGEFEGAARALLDAAEVERGAGRIPEAAAFAESAAELTVRFEDRREAIPILLDAARMARAAGAWRAAEQHYRVAGEIAGAAGRISLAARAAVGLGNLAIDRGAWKEAAARYDRAEAWARQAADPIPELWHLSLNRSIVARAEGRLDDAEEALRRARQLAAELGDQGADVILDNAEGQLLEARGQLDEAEVAFRLAMARAPDSDALVTVSGNLARLLLARGRNLEAGQIVRTGEEIALREGVIRRLPELYTIMGMVAAGRGMPDAFVFFERARDLVRERSLPPVEEARVLEAYAAYELQRGELESARHLLSSAEEIYGELEDVEGLERIDRLREGGGT